MVYVLPFVLLGACLVRKSPVSTLAKSDLGNRLFFDKMLSEPDGQACSVCHSPRAAFADPFNAPVSEGMVDGAFVNRNSQSLMYVAYIPPLSKDPRTGEYFGGLFWDGRSSALRHQLSGPLFNPAEMNNADTAALVNEIQFAPWRKELNRIYGKPKTQQQQYQALIDALAHFEESELFKPFNSAFDKYLVDQYTMSPEEKLGYNLFRGQAQCATCHSMDPIDEAGHILFTDFGYRNIGLPRNELNPYYTTSATINPNGHSAIDFGLGAVVGDSLQNGKFRTPTLRNVALTAPYFHHGGIGTLEEAVHFIVARDQMGLEPEFANTMERHAMGNLNLTVVQEQAIVAFLRLLSDDFSLDAKAP
jgi:cytochrome c peroxidase